jgi:pSer/pThr/pTyr-binding forkhead associated (FHA) protein
MSTLEILSGRRQGDKIDLGQKELDIGTKRAAAISIRDPWVSFKHGRIGFAKGQYFVEDFGSTNGTWIDGKRLAKNKPRTLQNGDLVFFGKTKTRFKEKKSVVSKAAPSSGEVSSLTEERDELKRMKEVLEKFLDVSNDQRNAIIKATKRPAALVDASAMEAQKEQVAQLETELKDAQEERQKTEESLIGAKRKFEDAHSALEKAKSENAELAQSVEDVNEKFLNAEKSAKADKENCQTLEAKLTTLSDQQSNLERKLEDAQLQAKQQAEALEASNNEKASGADGSQLEVEIKHLQERLEQREKAIEEANNSSQRQRQDLLAKNVELENQVANIGKKITQQDNYINDLKASAKKETEKATEELQKEIRAKSRAFEDSQRAQKSAEEQVKALSEQMNSAPAQADNTAMAEQLEKAKATVARLQEAAKAGGDGDTALQIEIDELKSELSRAMQDRDEALQEMQEVRAEIDELSMENITLEEKLEQLQS